MKEEKIAIIGGTGHTGSLIVKELVDKGVPFILAGRSKEKLSLLEREFPNSFETFLVDSTNLEDIKRLFEKDIRLIINCAGPFIEIGELVLKEAIEAGINYLDISGEQVFINLAQNYNNKAKEKGVIAISGMAFIPAMGDLLTSLCAKKLDKVDSVDIAYYVHSKALSSGTIQTTSVVMKNKTLAYENGRLVEKKFGTSLKWIDFPSPIGKIRGVDMPGGEIITIPLQFNVKNVSIWLAMKGSKKAEKLSQAEVEEYQKYVAKAILKGEKEGKDLESCVTVIGEGPYKTTAKMISYAVSSIQNRDFKAKGVLSPSLAFDPRQFLEFLSKEKDIKFTMEL